jgi:ABC-type hemin transport system substrate-binding protein
MKGSRRTCALGAASAAACALLAACGPQEETAAQPPRSAVHPELRVVSLQPAASAFALELGAGSALIGVDPESARLPGLGALPIVALEEVPELRPDLVLVPGLPPRDAPILDDLRAVGSDVVEVAPRDYDDVFALCRDLGVRLAGPDRAADFENALGRELAVLAAASHGRPRPRVAAVLGTEPLELASAHSFATDLIELAGGTSTTHDHAQPAPPTTPAELAASAPDLVLVVSSAPMTEPARAAARSLLGGTAPVEFFVLDMERFWVRDGSDAVRRLRALIEPLADALSR